MKLVSIFLMLFIGNASTYELKEAFSRYVKQYGKGYVGDEGEYMKRFDAFRVKTYIIVHSLATPKSFLKDIQ